MGVTPADVRGIDRAFSPFRVPSAGSRFSGGRVLRLNDMDGIFQCLRGEEDSAGISSSVFSADSADKGMPFNSAGEVTSTGSSSLRVSE
jgi:hypothetical protein